jgi:hypothetical protein
MASGPAERERIAHLALARPRRTFAPSSGSILTTWSQLAATGTLLTLDLRILTARLRGRGFGGGAGLTTIDRLRSSH